MLPRHPNVVRFIAILDSPLCLISEYCKEGSVAEWMTSSTYGESLMVKLALGIAKGISFFSQKNNVRNGAFTQA